MRLKKSWLIFLGLALCLGGAVALSARFTRPQTPSTLEPDEVPPGMARATFAGGCFWCTEAVFQQLRGVQLVLPGYCGGSVQNPTYRQIGSGSTGHAEAVQVTYDPAVISYEELLEVFWQSHDPTTPDRQGHDVGPQYRSVIFCHTPEQQRLAEHYKHRLDASGAFPSPIVTEIVLFKEFYRAEDYHQNYFARNSSQPYCRVVIGPKLEKLRKAFADRLKKATP
jgi:peptide-methionine (S)-S-oxide reductase